MLFGGSVSQKTKIKGKGISFMEGKAKYHGLAPTYEECEKGLCELEEYEKKISEEA